MKQEGIWFDFDEVGPIYWQRERRKSYKIHLSDEGYFVAKTPLRCNEKLLREIIHQSKDRMLRLRERVQSKIKLGPHNAKEIQEAKVKVKCAVADFFERYPNLPDLPARIVIKDQSSKWGSCSSRRNINLNYRLAYLPQHLFDYVLFHELSHLRYMDHSEYFWEDLRRYCSDFRACRKELKQYRIIANPHSAAALAAQPDSAELA